MKVRAVQQSAAPPQPGRGGPPPAARPPAPDPPPAARPSAARPPAARRAGPTAVAQRDRPATILDAFQGTIEPVRPTIGYQLGIALVALVMVLLPLCYVGIIGLVAYLLCLYAVHGAGLVPATGGRGARTLVVAYLAPLGAGAILVLFMIKPLFARPVKKPKTRAFDRRGEPLLFAFVDRVCAAVGAPRPSRIDVDCDVNASASFRNGVWSMFGNDLVLTIGLPLVAGLNLRQFAGVLAHEFGHFSQGAGMRLSYLIRSISWWFTRVVYERDAWDQRLVEWCEAGDFRLVLVLYLARFFVGVVRKILWVLMMIGHIVSGILLREMEFNADCYEARLAGSDVFESTMRRLAVLNVAAQGAYADLDEFRKEGRLGDNLPLLILANVIQIPGELLDKIDRGIDESTTGLFDTHPSDKDRIANAHREQAPGIFHIDEPATCLFTDFKALSKTVTWDFYRAVLGKEFKLTDMYPVEQLLSRQGKEQEDAQALARYFQGTFNSLRPLKLPSSWLEAPDDPYQSVDRLIEVRQRMLAAVAAYQACFQQYDRANTQALEACQAGVLLSVRLKVKPADFGMPLVNPTAALAARRAALAQMQQLAPQMEGLERSAGERLFLALQLLEVPRVAASFPDAAEHLDECRRILPALAAVNAELSTAIELRNTFAALAAMLGRLEGQRENAALLGSIEKHNSLVLRLLRQLQHGLSQAKYPFGHATRDPTVAEYLLPQPFGDHDFAAICEAANEMLQALPRLQVRLAGRLVSVAEKIESLFDLPPLPAPPARPAV